MFKVGDKVKINPESIYFSLDCQLPHGVIGHVTRDQGTDGDWVQVWWDGGQNTYRKEDLIKVSQFKGNK